MAERHTIDFKQCSFNVLSDGDRGTITLQFERAGQGRRAVGRPIAQVLTALQRAYGSGIVGRLHRLGSAEDDMLRLPTESKPHPDNPDVLCFEIEVKPGCAMDTALGAVLALLQQPEYLRTLGAPLDRDEPPSHIRAAESENASSTANALLREMMMRRRGSRSSRE